MRRYDRIERNSFLDAVIDYIKKTAGTSIVCTGLLLSANPATGNEPIRVGPVTLSIPVDAGAKPTSRPTSKPLTVPAENPDTTGTTPDIKPDTSKDKQKDKQDKPKDKTVAPIPTTKEFMYDPRAITDPRTRIRPPIEDIVRLEGVMGSGKEYDSTGARIVAKYGRTGLFNDLDKSFSAGIDMFGILGEDNKADKRELSTLFTMGIRPADFRFSIYEDLSKLDETIDTTVEKETSRMRHYGYELWLRIPDENFGLDLGIGGFVDFDRTKYFTEETGEFPITAETKARSVIRGLVTNIGAHWKYEKFIAGLRINWILQNEKRKQNVDVNGTGSIPVDDEDNRYFIGANGSVMLETANKIFDKFGMDASIQYTEGRHTDEKFRGGANILVGVADKYAFGTRVYHGDDVTAMGVIAWNLDGIGKTEFNNIMQYQMFVDNLHNDPITSARQKEMISFDQLQLFGETGYLALGFTDKGSDGVVWEMNLPLTYFGKRLEAKWLDSLSIFSRGEVLSTKGDVKSYKSDNGLEIRWGDRFYTGFKFGIKRQSPKLTRDMGLYLGLTF